MILVFAAAVLACSSFDFSGLGHMAYFIRFLLFVLLFSFTAWVVYSFIRKIQEPKEQQKLAEKMVRCDKCHVFVPKEDAVHSKGKYYCCKEHQTKAE